MSEINILSIIIFIFFQFLFIINFNKIAQSINIYDEPDNIRKKHNKKTSLLGGSIIFLSIIFNLYYFLNGQNFLNADQLIFKTRIDYIYFLVSCFFMYLIGLFDDKYNLNYSIKFTLTICVLLITLFFDKELIINEIYFSFYYEVIDISKVSFVFTILCFLLFINALNMFDGIDGQVGMYSVVFFIFILSIIGVSHFIVLLLISFFSFLFLNLKKKCFLGDNGTILIGFIISYLIIKLYNQNYIYFADQIFLIMAIPGIDMFRLFIERLMNKKNPFKPDNNHIHHLLQHRFGKLKSIIIVQVFIILPIIFSYFLNLLMIIFMTIIAYFLIVINLKNYKTFR